MDRLDMNQTWHGMAWHEQTRLTDSRLQHQYTTRNKGNDMATYSKQDWTHENNQPIRTWQNEQDNQSERDTEQGKQ